MSPIIATRASDSAQAFGFLGATGTPFALAGNYESIASFTVPSAGVSTVVFSSIPQTYAHLQLRMIIRNSANVGGDDTTIRLNGDSGSNYSAHDIYGNGSSAGSIPLTSQTALRIANNVADATYDANVFTGAIVDLLDYTNINKYKTVRSLFGASKTGGYVGLHSGLWMNTAAITSLNVYVYNNGSNNIAQYSSIALYGVKI